MRSADTPAGRAEELPWKKRWQSIIASHLGSLQRDGFRKSWMGRARPRNLSGGRRSGWLDLAVDSLSAFWVVETDSVGVQRARSTRDASSSPSAATLAASMTRHRRTFAPSRLAYVAVILLLILGVREIFVFSRPNRKKHSSIRVKGRDPFDVMADFAPLSSHPSSSLAAQERLWTSGGLGLDETTEQVGDELVKGDVAAVVLHWKRTANVMVIAASLCRYSFLDTVLIWNNNPEIHLTREMFKAAKCPLSKLRIYNSPRNMLFLARYLGCSMASAPYCFFQDDDWLVRPLRSLYSQFRRDPEGPIVVHTNPQVATLYGLEWCFFANPLHTCFSWVGTGAFAAKSHVTRYLSTISTLGYTSEELAHADNSFSLFQNEPPYVLSSELAQLPQPFGHSDGGEGIQRNKRYIQQGLVHLSNFLDAASGTHQPTNSSTPLVLPTAPLLIDTKPYRTPRRPPLPLHPHAHHARSPCVDDSCVFLTNIALLPPPDAAPYPGPDRISLGEWETHLGWFARGWVEGGELFAEEETWAIKWPYAAAVDGKWETTFRSPDVVREDDYIAVGLLAAVDAQWIPTLTLAFVLEDLTEILPLLVVEVSSDGYRWLEPQVMTMGEVPVPICRSTQHSSTRPDLSFPASGYFSSLQSEEVTMAEADALSSTSLLGVWYERRRRRSRKLLECKVQLSTLLDGASGEGWRFVRLRSVRDGPLGWGVYEIWLE